MNKWIDLQIKNLQPWERIEMVLKRHWIALVYIFWYTLFLIFSVALMLTFGASLPIIWPYINIILTVYISVFLLFIYIHWMSYELDLYIVTTKRIIWLEEVSFLNRHLSECSIDKVQEVNARTTWVLSNILNFWVITIHTASEVSDFQMYLVPDALTNARIISNFINENKGEQVKDNSGL